MKRSTAQLLFQSVVCGTPTIFLAVLMLLMDFYEGLLEFMIETHSEVLRFAVEHTEKHFIIFVLTIGLESMAFRFTIHYSSHILS